MNSSNLQFRLRHLLFAMSICAIVCWVFVYWWNIAILLSVSVCPAVITMLCLRVFRKRVPSTPRRNYSVSIFLALSMAFLVLYFLSAGPAFYIDVTYIMVKPGDSTSILLLEFYRPLQVFDRPENTARELMVWYMDQWINAAGVQSAGGG